MNAVVPWSYTVADYQFLRLGRSGYESIMSNLTSTADYLSQQVLKLGGGDLFELMSETEGRGLPLVAWRIVKADVGFDEFAIAGHLRQRGWIVPACESSWRISRRREEES